MGRGVQRTCRRVAGAFALIGVAFYALLLPGHLTSQFDKQLFAAEFGDAAQLICSSSSANAPSIPGAPGSTCPICKGLAAFQLALTPAPTVVPPIPAGRAILTLPVREAAIGVILPSPRSRGPPSQA
jgi:hypothetical protein